MDPSGAMITVCCAIVKYRRGMWAFVRDNHDLAGRGPRTNVSSCLIDARTRMFRGGWRVSNQSCECLAQGAGLTGLELDAGRGGVLE